MRTRLAVACAVAACLLFTLLRPVAAQTTTTTSSTTTTTVDPAVVASRAASSLALPPPEIRMNPEVSRDQVVNLPTWLWVEPRNQQRTTRTEGPTSVEVTASVVSVRFDTGDGETLTCPGGGTPYDPARAESAQRSTCTHTWRHSSASAPGGTYRLTATVTWGLGWSGGSLGTRQSTGSADVRVAEAQSLDRPPAPLPGQTILGGPGAEGAENPRAGGGPGEGSRPAGSPDKPKKPSLFERARGAVGNFFEEVRDKAGDAAGAVARCFGGEHTCLKVGGTILGGAVAAVGVGALCVVTVGAGCVAAGLIAGGIAGGGLGGGLFCGQGQGLAGCVGKGALLGGVAAAPFIFLPATLGGLVAAGALGGFGSTALGQFMSGHFDPQSLFVNTLVGAGTGGILRGVGRFFPRAGGAGRGRRPSEAAPVEPAWRPPPGLRLPAAERGVWAGTRGNSEWIPNDPAHWGLKPGQAIPFRQGVPDFRGFAHPMPSGRPGVFEVPGLTGNPKGDYNAAVAHIAKQEGMSQSAVREWLDENSLRIHHYKGDEVQLVPGELHKVAHQGGALELRNLAESSE